MSALHRLWIRDAVRRAAHQKPLDRLDPYTRIAGLDSGWRLLYKGQALRNLPTGCSCHRPQDPEWCLNTVAHVLVHSCGVFLYATTDQYDQTVLTVVLSLRKSKKRVYPVLLDTPLFFNGWHTYGGYILGRVSLQGQHLLDVLPDIFGRAPDLETQNQLLRHSATILGRDTVLAGAFSWLNPRLTAILHQYGFGQAGWRTRLRPSSGGPRLFAQSPPPLTATSAHHIIKALKS